MSAHPADDLLPIDASLAGGRFTGTLTIGNVKVADIFAALRETVEADAALTAAFGGGASVTPAIRRFRAALDAQRSLLARIDSVLPPEFFK
jgi:hypothetical protein